MNGELGPKSRRLEDPGVANPNILPAGARLDPRREAMASGRLPLDIRRRIATLKRSGAA
jgi:hypothetical protein